MSIVFGTVAHCGVRQQSQLRGSAGIYTGFPNNPFGSYSIVRKW